jgi:hypothetical protein
MIGRPCKPDPDVNWLRRTLLPDTPPLACGMANDKPTGMIDEERRAYAPAGRSWFRKLWRIPISAVDRRG